jgi:hypothetical protein
VKINKLSDKLAAGAVAAVVTALLVTAPVAHARDTLQKLSLEPALAKAQASGKLAPGIKLFFGTQKYPKPTALTQYAQRVGGNAIVNIRSNYKNVPFSSETEYQCGAGNVTGGTAFVGDVVKLP